ncbi:3-hydroxyacyl-CoA dehydrogenase [Sphingobium sp. AP50]|uniref:3-hydroxyacyl-CoA dehydrogenase NAD-binding domain-containing protein n=1 Tax=Sphingobium sp. AP50 TaxID=1884369 RepID=UPI0008AEDDA6|nr:3-hydroxyacyl-CoA dehydrogenase NAD-binding domain-containing protein [Sphingobium sp. AP50]SEJ74219.1 3-hydroxyacyl-CoA dehydrogenase [Sphingobium sp. AP50]
MTCSHYSIEDGIAVLTIDNPPVNALSQAIRQAIIDAVASTAADPKASALLITCAGKTFCAGADIREFDQPPLEPHLPDVIEAMLASPKPVCCALHGTVLGGGLEIAMAAHGRVAAPETKLGLPEVKLGLMPGARGTQLLARLVGVEKALAMACSGDPIDATEALTAGLIDILATGDPIDAAKDWLNQNDAARPTNERPIPLIDPAVIDAYLTANARKFRGLDAPPAIARAIRAAMDLPYQEAAALERALFLKLRAGPQSRALRHLFQAERATAKLPELEGVTPRPIDRVGVIGAGTMGTGIAINFLLAGIPVTLVEQNEAALGRGVATIGKTIDGNVASARTNRDAADQAGALLTASLDYAALSDADLIIEAAFETMDVKTAIFTRLGDVARPGAILATNTSYLDVDAIAAAGGRPADTVGLHFFSPANIMKLLEIVRGAETASDVLATALALAKRIGKVPVVAGNAYGFIGNRMLAVRRREAEGMITQGASPYVIDRVLEGFGMPMGPFRIGDLAGLDLGWSAETSTGSTIRERLCEAGRHGQKTNAGFYDYDERRRPSPSPVAEDIIASFARDKGIAQRAFGADEILARLLWPMVDEGAALLSEGIARSASDIDMVWLTGYGWPSWTGGPMFHAAETGYAKVVGELEALGYEPSAKLRALAAEQG